MAGHVTVKRKRSHWLHDGHLVWRHTFILEPIRREVSVIHSRSPTLRKVAQYSALLSPLNFTLPKENLTQNFESLDFAKTQKTLLSSKEKYSKSRFGQDFAKFIQQPATQQQPEFIQKSNSNQHSSSSNHGATSNRSATSIHPAANTHTIDASLR